MPTLAELFELQATQQDPKKQGVAPPDSANAGVRPRAGNFETSERTTFAGVKRGLGNRLRSARDFVATGLEPGLTMMREGRAPESATRTKRFLDGLITGAGEEFSDFRQGLADAFRAARETIGELVDERREFFRDDDAEPFDLDRVLEEQGSIPEILERRRRMAERLDSLGVR